MSRFVLRDGFQVDRAHPGGGRLVHLRTGDALELAPEDLDLLEHAAAGGLDANDPWVADGLERFRNLGVLVPLPGGRPTVAPEQPVPHFRQDLKIEPRPSSALVDVSSPGAVKGFQLYDFEVSLARMLDGRRTHAEVVAAAQRLGLPVTLTSLVQFIRQLELYGFLTPPEVAVAPVAAAAPTGDEAIRALIESGPRMHRQGRYVESATYFEAVLAQDPAHAEAIALLKETNERAANPPRPSLPLLPPPVNPAVERFDELSWDDAPAAPGQGAAPVVAPVPAASAPPRPRRVPRVVWIVAGLVAIAGLGWTFFRDSTPVASPHPDPKVAAVGHDAGDQRGATATVSAGLDAGSSAANRDAGVALAGSSLDAGAAATASADPARDGGAAVASANSARDGGAAGVTSADSARDGGAAVASASSTRDGGAAVASADSARDGRAAVASADSARDGGAGPLVARITKRGRVTMGEITAPADGVVLWKVAPEQHVKKGERVGTLRGAGGEVSLVAPKEGLVIQKVDPGGEAKSAEVVATILYFEAYLQTVVVGGPPDPSWSCEVVDAASGEHAECKIVSAVPRGAGTFVTATVLPRWFDAATEVQLKLAPP